MDQWDPGDCHSQTLTPSPEQKLTLCRLSTDRWGGGREKEGAVWETDEDFLPLIRACALRLWAISAQTACDISLHISEDCIFSCGTVFITHTVGLCLPLWSLMLGEGLCPAASEYAAPPTEDWGGGGGGGGRASYRGKEKKKKKSHYFSLCHLFPLSLNQKDQEKKQNGPQEEEKNQTDCTLHKHRNQFVYEKQRKKKNERSSVIWVIPSSCQHQGEWFGSLRRLVPDVPLQRRISFSACLFVARTPHSLMLNPLQYLIGNIWSEKHVCWHTWEQPSNQSWVDSSWLTCFPLVNVFKVKRGSSFWLEAFRGFSLYVFCASRITGLKYKSPTSSVTTQSRSTILERSQKFTRLIFHVWKL